MDKQEYQQFDDEVDQAKNNATDVMQQMKDAQDIGKKAAQYLPGIAQKGEQYAEKGHQAYNIAAGYATEAWHSGGIYYEQGEHYIRDHSKMIRVVVAVLTFPIWLPFYQFMHTTLRSWEITIAVIRHIKTTSKKMLFILFMLFFGCYPLQLILGFFGFVHLFNNCKQFQEEGKVVNGFHSLVWENECNVAQKAQKTLLVVFADYEIQVPPQDDLTSNNNEKNLELQKQKNQSSDEQQSNQFDVNSGQFNMTNNNQN